MYCQYNACVCVGNTEGIAQNRCLMRFIHMASSIFITCVGGKRLQLLVGVELRSHDTT